MFSRKALVSSGLHLLALLVFSFVYFLTGPEVLRSPHELFADRGDTLIAISLMSWVRHCIGISSCNIPDFPIFFPDKGALFFTEHMIGMSIIYAFYLKILTTPWFAYNLTIITFDFTNFYSLFFLMRFMGIGYIGAFMAGASFSLMPYLMQYLPHIQLHPLFLWPFSLIALIKFFETKRPVWLYAIAMMVA